MIEEFYKLKGMVNLKEIMKKYFQESTKTWNVIIVAVIE